MAIYPNGRGLGVALMTGAKSPIDARTLEISSKETARYLYRIENLIGYYRPAVLVAEDTDENPRKSKRVRKLLEKVQAMAEERGLPFHRYSRQQIRETFASFGATTRYEIAELLHKWFPELALCLPGHKKSYESEHFDMGAYDALGLAMTHYYHEG